MKKNTINFIDIDESAADLRADIYYGKYRNQLDAYLRGSSRFNVNESISPFEVLAVGQMFDQYLSYQDLCESQGNLGSLGVVPQIALDVITASVGNSVIPLLASIQPMREEQGIVYYKQIQAATDSVDYKAGDVIADPRMLDNIAQGNLGSMRKSEVLGETLESTLEYTLSLSAFPVRPYMVDFNVVGIGSGKDDGNGKVLGFGFSGTINYNSGRVDLIFATNPGEGHQIQVMYDLDVDSLQKIDKIKGSLVTTNIRAEIWALQADVGSFANYAFGQRFGRSAMDEVAADLTNEITRVLNTQAIKRLAAGSMGTYEWSKTPPAAVSYAEHKLTFIDAIAGAESNLHLNSGANSASRFIAGQKAAAVLRGLPNFVPAQSNVSVGLFGFYDGIPVIRATKIIPDNELLLVANGSSYFNSPLAYAPFMPLMITNTVQSPSNPFQHTQAAGVWAGMKQLNGRLVTKIVITETPTK